MENPEVFEKYRKIELEPDWKRHLRIVLTTPPLVIPPKKCMQCGIDIRDLQDLVDTIIVKIEMLKAHLKEQDLVSLVGKQMTDLDNMRDTMLTNREKLAHIGYSFTTLKTT